MQQKILNNRYELEQKIGEGGMARVYRGRDLRLNRLVAIKVLHPQYASDAGFLNRFQHEAQAAANLRHPNIVDVYDVGQDGDIHYIVMEFVEGRDLKQLILQSGPLSVEQSVAIARAVADALEAAHNVGLVHRDIKPQNIIIGASDRVKITDFGIAKSRLSTAATETGVIFGTADYISPEQARGQTATPASDIYSLGVTLYEMLTGRLPFSGDNSIAVAMQHVSADPPPLRMINPRIPPQLEGLVLRALDKDPARRPASAREFNRLLQGYVDLNDQQTVVRPVAPRPAPRPTSRPSSPPTSRPTSQTGTTSPRISLPPRPVVVAPPDRGGGGIGFGGFILGLLLLGGVLGLVYLFAIGAFNDLFSPITIARPSQSTATAAPTGAPTAEPTAGPTALPQVLVPSIVGLNEPAAVTALQDAGFGAQHDVRADRNSDTIAENLVVDQLPASGALITQTSVITYGLSLGPELVDVPDVTRLRQANAESTLRRAGFQVQAQEESSTVDAGFVIRQSPFAGARLPRGDTVTIVVSIGNQVRVPEVQGLSVDEATRRIEGAGLFVSFIDQQDCQKLGDQICSQFAPGAVVSSAPRGGEQVERGTGVTIGVRKPE